MPNIPIADQNIIKILGLEALPDERRIVMVEKISSLVQKRLLLRVMEYLKSPQKDEFMRLLDGEQSLQIGSFLEKNVPEFGEWMSEEVRKVKQELAGLVA